MQTSQGGRKALVVARQATEAAYPRETALDGLLTNDKFCFDAHGDVALELVTTAVAPAHSVSPEPWKCPRRRDR